MTLLVAAVAALINTPAWAQGEPAAPSLSRADLSKLIEALRGEPERPLKVRLQAALIMGRLGGPDAVDALIECLDYDPEYAVRAACVLALGNIGELDSIEALAGRLDDTEAVVREEARKSLAKLARPEALPYLQAARERGSSRVREGLVEVVAGIKVPEASRLLVELIGDPDRKVQVRAEAVLATMEATAANELLVAGLQDPNYRVRERAATLLGQRKVVAAANQLVDMASAPLEAAQVQRAARGALKEMRELLDVQGLSAVVRDQAADRAVRQRALVVVSAAGGSDALQVCLDALNDPQESMRGAAAQALADLGDPRALAPLREAAAKPENARVARVLSLAIRKLER